MGHPIEWPPRSPDLTLLDFFLWGYIKSEVYRTPLASLQVLGRRIQTAFRGLRRTRAPKRAMYTMLDRARRCLNNNGGYVEGRGGH